MQIDLSHFFKRCETIEESTVLIQSSAILFIFAGLIQIAFGLFVKNVVFPGIVTVLIGSILYFVSIPAVGMVCFLWAIMPVLGSFTTRFGVNIAESFYSLFTLAPLFIGFRAYLATKRLDKLRFPDEDDEKDEPKKTSDKPSKQKS